jgi:hypothetical protein
VFARNNGTPDRRCRPCAHNGCSIQVSSHRKSQTCQAGSTGVLGLAARPGAVRQMEARRSTMRLHRALPIAELADTLLFGLLGRDNDGLERGFAPQEGEERLF